MNKTILVTLILMLSINLKAQTVEGQIKERTSGEPLIGVQLIVEGTSIGCSTDINGNYILKNLPLGNHRLNISYISYKPIVSQLFNIQKGKTINMNFSMETEELLIDELFVLGRKNLENELALKNERKIASAAIENLGAKEMSIKGISTVADGVKKISGISFTNAGQLFVRGLGDRYSITTLNGLPIASPNPDNKLIPLDIFPSSAVKNITISKVYQASTFADYSGAHIDISTRENTGDDFFSISASLGGHVNTLFKDFYKSDANGGMFRSSKLGNDISQMTPSQFSNYIKTNDPFKTGFSITKKTSLPDISLWSGYGKTFNLGSDKLSLLLNVGLSNEKSIMNDAYIATLNAQGLKLNEFTYDSYTNLTKLAALASFAYSFSKGTRINYTLFYARNAVDDYKKREGFDSEGINLVGSNSVFHAYSLLNNQLSGIHSLNKKFELSWAASYGLTSSSEPDRRQVMFRVDEGNISLFKLNKQETMRYFGKLNENEIVGDLKLKYAFGTNNYLRLGTSYKTKTRDYSSTRFYYNLQGINPTITDIYNTDDYLNIDNIKNSSIGVSIDNQPKFGYNAASNIASIFADTDYYIGEHILLNIGLRYEISKQWVDYYNDASIKKRSTLNKNDLFPALNLKYTFNREQSLRFALSKTVTRPSFVEMAPFLYKESYGSAELRGNENLQNGYNYNVDLRYEYLPSNNDLISVTAYYKRLKSPIERVQESSGGSAIHSFRNADDGMAAGAELEIRKSILPTLNIGMNVSYMYTNVDLPEGGGVYTDSQRALQGASPYLLNADIRYSPKISKEGTINFTLLYNLQGPRIQTVGIYGMSNIVQLPMHSLDFVWGYNIDKNWILKAQVKNILNCAVSFTQEVKTTGQKVEVERFKRGVDMEIGFSYKF